MFLRHEMMFEDFYRFYGYMTVVIMNYSIMLNHIHMSSRQNPLHLSSCYCYGYHFWGGPIAFQGFVEISIFEIQHEAKIHS